MKMKKYDVTALGELLVDFTENGISPQGNLLFEANPGGAPGNVLAMLQKLGRKTAFIGKVGKDFFGEQLKAALEETGISAEGLRADETTPQPWPLSAVLRTETGIFPSIGSLAQI